MSSPFNPYLPPTGAFKPIQGKAYPLADLGKRFVGALVDAFAGLVFCAPGFALIIIGLLSGNRGIVEPIVFVGIAVTIVGSLATMATQIYLLYTRSQTIGKYLMKTQIVSFETGERADFISCFLMRLFLNSLLGGLPCVGPIYSLVDICYIFREDRRCIHDLIAKTQVVDIS